jgi:hypothetical protein
MDIFALFQSWIDSITSAFSPSKPFQVSEEDFQYMWEEQRKLAEKNANSSEGKNPKEIHWLNLWNIESNSPLPDDRLARIAKALVKQYFNDHVIITYGFIVNPVGSTITQNWHFDYTLDTGSVYLSMTETSEKNALQFFEFAEPVPKDFIMECVKDDPTKEYLNMATFKEYTNKHNITYKVAQNITPPNAVTKVDCGTIHRGIPNIGDYDRVHFFVFVSKDKEKVATNQADSAYNNNVKENSAK